MMPTSPLSGVISAPQLSPVKSSASSINPAVVHGLSSADVRRESFPPYAASTSKHSTAIVTPFLSRTRPSTLPVASSSVVQSTAVTPVHFPSLPSTTHQRWLSAPLATPLSHPCRSAQSQSQSMSKVMSDLSRRYADSMSICRSTGARSLLAPPTASSGISYSLALSSALTPSSRSSTSQVNRICLNLSGTGQKSTSRLALSHPVGSSTGNSERRQQTAHEAYLHRRPTNELVSSYNLYAAMPQRQTSSVVTTIHRPNLSFTSQPLTHTPSLVQYYQRPQLNSNQMSLRPAQYAGQLPLSSLPSVSSQQTASNAAGRFIH